MDVGASSLEGFFVRLSVVLGAFICVAMLVSCSTSYLKYEKADELKANNEFDQAVKIVKTETPPTESATSAVLKNPEPTTAKKSPNSKKAPKGKTPKEISSGKEVVSTSKGAADSKKSTKAVDKKKAAAAPVKSAEAEAPAESVAPAVPVRQPDIEDAVGFAGRRPLKDPFRPGEEVVHDVHYFKVSAGELRLKVEPFSMVNGRKSYTFAIEIRTTPLFSTFYSVEDRAETFVDYETLVPSVFQLHVKESGQLREAKMLFDSKNNTATFWEKKVTKDHGEEEKKQHWDILEYTQNVYSAVFYMRNFQWETGKEYSFRVANDNENMVFSGKALRREILDTKLGPMKAIVIQPNIVLKGKFKPIGDNFIWLSDDDRRYILRIESKIKIGTLISEVVSITP